LHVKFTTKARTLNSLQGVLKTAHIAPLYFFTVADWNLDRSSCLAGMANINGNNSMIVRSSSRREDGLQYSNAGAFLSVLNVNAAELESSVEKVIASYGEAHSLDEVLIQPMLKNVVRSGVALSHDPNNSSPYRVVNWSDGNDTARVTGGMGGRVWQQAANSPVTPAPEISSVLALLDELLILFNDTPLDFEFAITSDGLEEVLWLLQVRPLILPELPESNKRQAERLIVIQHKVARGMQSHPFLMGKSTVYGVMPDWNPAEIIGIRPKPLALSLYRELITDAIWAYQRHNYGYRNLRSFPLMPHFFGLPYIDARLSFNSFIPVDLDDYLAGKLVDYYIDRLLTEPTLHDKVEFEIVLSCYTFDLPNRLGGLAEAGFSENERNTIARSLQSLTNRIVHPHNGLWRGDATKMNILNLRRESLLSSGADPLERIYWLLEDAKRYGTLPFAGLARAGFVAVQMLKSLVAVGVFSQSDYDEFIGGVSTVSSQLSYDRAAVDRTTFLARFGHLRPGTYDILSSRYDQAPELYFDWGARSPAPNPTSPFSLTLPQKHEIMMLLNQHGLEIDPAGLLEFMQSGIELRELSKFQFTRNLSDALELIAEYGGKYGFSRDDLSYCDISAFKELHVAATNSKDILLRSIEQGKSRYGDTLKITLPPLIARPEDVWAFEWPETSPNFITQKEVTAPVVDCSDNKKLQGAIVCIPSADPGFDWLFSYPISGLITAWGGVNSHMAIRAGELGLPAVIGAGELLYRRWSSAQRIYLDCSGRRVEVLN
jgi:phosphohistidine swiveling domain-containing protein